MQQERTFSEEIKFQFRYGGMHIRLILVNTAFFLAILLLSVLEGLTHSVLLALFKEFGFTLQTDLTYWYLMPFELVTSIFSHFGFLHFLLNMIFLYLVGPIFRQLFSDRRMLHVYLVGGIVGGLFELLSHWFFPVFEGQNASVLGASGSIMALFFAVAIHRPNMQVNLFGIIPIRIIFIAAIFVISDLVQMIGADGVAHFAHIGGALVGALSVTNLYSSSNIINMTESMQQRLARWWSNRKKSTLKVERGGNKVKSDEEYNLDRKKNQEKIDKILDKISKSGYESLTKAEKDFLFSQGNK